jgi:hypothetical protein
MGKVTTFMGFFHGHILEYHVFSQVLFAMKRSPPWGYAKVLDKPTVGLFFLSLYHPFPVSFWVNPPCLEPFVEIGNSAALTIKPSLAWSVNSSRKRWKILEPKDTRKL